MKKSTVSRQRNWVAKNNFNRPKVERVRTVFRRHAKHRNQESL